MQNKKASQHIGTLATAKKTKTSYKVAKAGRAGKNSGAIINEAQGRKRLVSFPMEDDTGRGYVRTRVCPPQTEVTVKVVVLEQVHSERCPEVHQSRLTLRGKESQYRRQIYATRSVQASCQPFDFLPC